MNIKASQDGKYICVAGFRRLPGNEDSGDSQNKAASAMAEHRGSNDRSANLAKQADTSGAMGAAEACGLISPGDIIIGINGRRIGKDLFKDMKKFLKVRFASALGIKGDCIYAIR